MDNPLTLEEKVSVPRLIGHDLMSKQNEIARQAYGMGNLDPSIAYGLNQIVRAVLISVDTLTQYGPFHLRVTDPHDIHSMLENLSRKYTTGVRVVPTVDSQISTQFNSEINLLYTMMHNLIKNSQRLVDPEQGAIHISATELFGRAEHLVYRSPETHIAGGFIRFNVHDNGPGFPADRPLGEFLQSGVTTREKGGGFGLYYVSLVAKVLRSHIGIESEPSNTTVSFYHPVNLQ
ncbi:MAG: ATP-binding protein [Nanoarchaeota archaeon]|nr:MAG: ATP-binding protein [Nanoarchaeota archaeon]